MRQSNRRKFLKNTGVIIGAGVSAGCVGNLTGGNGGEYPSQEFTLLNPYPPGGGTDVYFSQFVDALSKKWDVNVKQEYVPGGASAKAMRRMSQTDSQYLVGWQDIPIQTVLQFKLENPGFNIKDQKSICVVATQAVNLIVPGGSDYNTFKKLRNGYQNGDISTIAGFSTGSSWHWAIWQMKQKWNLNWSKYVAYDGGGPLKSAVLKGEVDAGVLLATPLSGFVKNGDIDVVMTVGDKSPPPLSVKVPTPDKFDLDPAPIRNSGGQLTLSIWGPSALTDDHKQILEKSFIEMMNSETIQNWSKKTGQQINPAKGKVAEKRLEKSFELKNDYQKFRKEIS